MQFQRLIIILLSMTLLTGAVILILVNSKNNLIFFFTPSELFETVPQLNQEIRIGGFVKKNSIKNIFDENQSIVFIITDNQKDIIVQYQGILPDLFREKQGVVVEGILIKKNKLKAKKIFAKHDENYMPASIKKQLEEDNYWQNNYISQSIPRFKISSLIDEKKILSNQDMNNKIVLINFFASWCAPCKIEHPLLVKMQNQFPELFIIGINHKDNKEDAIHFLNKEGNPYHFVGNDHDGNIGLEFGIINLPETLLSNEQGKIIFKHMGPLTKNIIKKNIIPLL